MKKSDAHTKTSRRKILIYGYTRVNFGDDLFFKILVERYPDIDFYMLSDDDYSPVIRCENFHSVRRNRVNRIFASHIPYQFYLHRFDAVVCIGGSIFMEVGTSGRNRFTRFLLKYKRKFPKVPIYIVGSNYGPERTPMFREAVKNLFSLAESVSLRDTFSYNIFKDNPHVECVPDVIFQLDVAPKGENRDEVVGFSLIDLSPRALLREYAEPYEKFILHHVKKALAENKRVRLLSFCTFEGDKYACESIVAKLDKEQQDRVEIVAYEGDIATFLESLRTVDLLYASRFHAAILGISMQIPTIPIIYSDKTLNVLQDLAYEGDVVDIRSIGDVARNLTTQVMERSVIEGLNRSAQNHFRALNEMIARSK